MRLADEVRIQLKGMNPVERESAVRELREVIYEDAYETIASRDDVLACPRCGSIGIVREGHNPVSHCVLARRVARCRCVPRGSCAAVC